MSTVGMHFNACSRGKAKVEPHVVSNIVTLPCTFSSQSCDVNNWADSADAILRSQNVRLEDYPYRIYVLPNNVGCTWGGLGFVGPSCAQTGCRVWIAGSVANQPSVYFHELGHNLGLNHASYAGQEYGDYTSAMGACCFLGCYNAAQSDYLHWTTPKQTFNTPVTLITSIDLAANEYIKIIDQSTYSTWFVQYRTPDFVTDKLMPGFINTVFVYMLPSGSAQSYLQQIMALKQPFYSSGFQILYNEASPNMSWANIIVKPSNQYLDILKLTEQKRS
jgi:hypothetical protein